MKKRDAKRYVCQVIATTIENDLEHASWVEQDPTTGEPLSDDDFLRVLGAAKELRDELYARSEGRR